MNPAKVRATSGRSLAEGAMRMSLFALPALLGGCLLVYDYGGYERAGNGGGGGEGGGEACSANDQMTACFECIEATQCGTEVGQCGSAGTCDLWFSCVKECSCPSC